MDHTDEWKALGQHYQTIGRHLSLRQLFAADPGRADRFSVELATEEHSGLFVYDYSKNLVDADTMGLLERLAERAGLADRIEALFTGRPLLNTTEQRAVLHTALRGTRAETDFDVDGGGERVGEAVERERSKMYALAEQVRQGGWRGHTGQTITDVVNIGIGGSDLGPAMACQALACCPETEPGPGSGSAAEHAVRVHFVSNVDGGQLAGVLRGLRGERTLFIVVSKTFTTQETLANARAARQWLLSQATRGRVPEEREREIVRRHFVAVSTASDRVAEFGIDPEGGMLRFWEWVGGRFSIWSAVGLSLAIAIGPARFDAFLAGARAVDVHFRTTPLSYNIPVIMGLLQVWYASFWGAQAAAVLPYEQALARLPAYLQQLEMESNGKSSVLQAGRPDHQACSYPTCPVIWGEPGTNGQHAFFQLLHQGTLLVPCDFLLARHPQFAGEAEAGLGFTEEHHRMLIANCLGQTRALMLGDPEAALHYRRFPGNRPTSTLLYDRLTPYTLGALIAIYEHKVFVAGTLWGVNSFDQWGVELGKATAATLLPYVGRGTGLSPDALDPSTRLALSYLNAA